MLMHVVLGVIFCFCFFAIWYFALQGSQCVCVCACVHVRKHPAVGHLLHSAYHPTVLYKGTAYVNVNPEHG